MDRYGYVLRQKDRENIEKRYHKAELELMTVFQLREICRKEKIIQGMIDPMDKEELIRTVLRFRGAEEFSLIQEADEEGLLALGRLLQKTKLRVRQDGNIKCSSKITVYEGRAIGFYDGLTLPYDTRLVGTNALAAGGDGTVCAVLNVVQKGGRTDCLYLTKAAGLPCRESNVKNYSLYCMGRRESDMLYEIYSGKREKYPEYLEVFRMPLLDFEVRKPIPLSMPLVIDFGTNSTAAGVYLDRQYFEKAGLCDGERGLKENDVNHAVFYDVCEDQKESVLLPSAAGVRSMEAGQPQYLFGYEAVHLAESSYIDEGFCVFYDIKRWAGDYEKEEEITDRQGRRGFVSRKDILRAYFEYVIKSVENQFKCEVSQVHILCPLKQKAQFGRLTARLLPEYAVEKQDMPDESAAVLYHSIGEMIQRGVWEDGREYKALMIHCGGGAGDLCSCSFRIWDERVSYRIEMCTAYENGYIDFGGNHITYRIMQLLKIVLVNRMKGGCLESEETILAKFDRDVFRYVDQYGTEEIYKELVENYEKAEQYIPTRFQEFENKSRADYYKVKNNFYFLFRLAEAIKKEFHDYGGTWKVVVTSRPAADGGAVLLAADKWKLSVRTDRGLETVKEFPEVCFHLREIELLLRADIYGCIHGFLEKMYQENMLEEYSMIKLIGQSCRMDMFRDALKEYVPGKMIRFGGGNGGGGRAYELKTACIDGALKYIRDKRYGFAEFHVKTQEPALPYCVAARTHSGEEVVLIHPLERDAASGMISRNMEDLTLRLSLKDSAGVERHQYVCEIFLSDFQEKKYDEIYKMYGEHILQADTDDIVENEVRFFVWARPEEWAFSAVPVYRRDERLYIGREEEFYFEDEAWVPDFFDGMR